MAKITNESAPTTASSNRQPVHVHGDVSVYDGLAKAQLGAATGHVKQLQNQVAIFLFHHRHHT